MSDQHPESDQQKNVEQVTDPQQFASVEPASQVEQPAAEQNTPVENAPVEHGQAGSNEAGSKVAGSSETGSSEPPAKAPRARRRSASRPAGPPAQAPTPPAAPVVAAAAPEQQNEPAAAERASEPAPVKQAPKRPARKRVTRAQAPAEAKIEVESSTPAVEAEPEVPADNDSEGQVSDSGVLEGQVSDSGVSEGQVSKGQTSRGRSSKSRTPKGQAPESGASGSDSDSTPQAQESGSQHSDIPNPFAKFQAPAPAQSEDEQKPTRSRRRPTRRVSDPFAVPEPVPAARKTETTQPAWDEDDAEDDKSVTQEAVAQDSASRESAQDQAGQGQSGNDFTGQDQSTQGQSVQDESENEDDDDSDSDNSDSDNSDDPNRRRRRRRGGRRRRRGGDSDGSSSGEDSEESSEDSEQSDSNSGGGRRRGGRQSEAPRDSDNSDDSENDEKSQSNTSEDSNSDEGDSKGPSTEGENGESTSGRRRRRRRRRGEDDSASSEDDPADVVTRVREPRNRRKPSDEVTGIEGSTRMEAKRQRRRDGRTASRRRSPILSESEFLSRRESVDRKMVIRQTEGLSQLAVIEDGSLVEHYVDRDSAASLIGNVYLGRVQNVLPSMEAAFIDIGRGRNAVLYAGEVDWDSFGAGGKSRQVQKVLKSGQTILVQVTKDPVGAKGARLTNHVSIPGRYIVYAPNGHLSGISRKLPENERRRLKDILGGLVDESASFIVRTAAEGATEDELVRDVNRLKAQWESIEKLIKAGQSPQQLYSEPDLTVRIVRDLFTEDFSELIISGNSGGNDAYDTVDAYVAHVAPHLKERMTRWDDEADGDVFSAHRLNEQIAKALERKVFLPSGGSLVIDRTEAMTVIDVNTGKFTGSGGNLEATVTSNNLEAAEEVVRQLRLRDIGGIIVVDFIDMVLPSNRELLLRRLVECLGRDRTRHQVAEVTSLGLVQMTRKKIGTGLAEAFTEPCECCDARGYQTFDMPVDSQDHADGGKRSSRGGRRGGGGGNRGGGQNSGNQSSGGQNSGGQNSGNQNSGNQGQGKQDPPKPGDHRASRSNGAEQGSGPSGDAATEDSGSAVASEANPADNRADDNGVEDNRAEGVPTQDVSTQDVSTQDKPKSGKSKSGKSKSGKGKKSGKAEKSGQVESEQAASEPAPGQSEQSQPDQDSASAPAGTSSEDQPSNGATVGESPAPKSRSTRSRRSPKASTRSEEAAPAPADSPQVSDSEGS